MAKARHHADLALTCPDRSFAGSRNKSAFANTAAGSRASGVETKKTGLTGAFPGFKNGVIGTIKSCSSRPQ